MSRPKLSFAKLASGVSTPAEPAPIPTPTREELRQRLAGIRREAARLTAERAALALNAEAGDTKSLSSIASIDAERQKLAAREETLEAALDALARQPRAAQLAECNPARLKKHLQFAVAEKRELLLFSISRNHFQGQPERVVHDHIMEADPYRIACQLLESAVKREQVYWDSNASPNAAQQQQRKLDQERDAEINRLAAELVASANLPPLPAEIAKLMPRD